MNLELTPPLSKLMNALHAAGAKPLLVGGCVRDALLGLKPKDHDVEVYHIDAPSLEQELNNIGSVHAVGRAFGVLKVTVQHQEQNETIDVSLPRTENKKGQGHRGFIVTPDPSLDFHHASLRRDFTINAMGYDPITQTLLDPHGGQKDLDAKILRHVSEAFGEDPLRVLRAAQFKARFGLNVATETLQLCRALKEELSHLPKERLYWEFEKLFLQSTHPASGLRFLQECHALSLFPELIKLIDCPQEPEWHPEGDVWYHTLLVLDEAARLCREEKADDTTTLTILFAALCHDLAKPATTKRAEGRIRSRGHENGGEKPTRKLLERLGVSKGIIETVVQLVKEHLKPYQLYAVRDEVSDAALKRLSLRAPIKELCLLARADCFGRTTPEALAHKDVATDWLWQQSQRLQLKKEPPTPILQGRHLIEMGLQPGPSFKKLLAQAFDAQLESLFVDEHTALAWAKLNLIE